MGDHFIIQIHFFNRVEVKIWHQQKAQKNKPTTNIAPRDNFLFDMFCGRFWTSLQHVEATGPCSRPICVARPASRGLVLFVREKVQVFPWPTKRFKSKEKNCARFARPDPKGVADGGASHFIL